MLVRLIDVFPRFMGLINPFTGWVCKLPICIRTRSFAVTSLSSPFSLAYPFFFSGSGRWESLRSGLGLGIGLFLGVMKAFVHELAGFPPSLQLVFFVVMSLLLSLMFPPFVNALVYNPLVSLHRRYSFDLPHFL
ncbi:hypothetical protein P170DRAFT_88204 [Aspergillus steynii IBT 23096]|uniref:Uncharacterized protein n=1 Tax=Aspergillus steynii IBT 23096 TaxID=1392250 RepID=A0A2I2GFZ9_9EURO|nr:uncharacterized protein P170DRAFT_88204 [Aspergillus steynii IBT 23096]PLB51801.1 hypothetical protein P170DRAFT_88204 [Aspergillus steynii IBT 23096]